MVKKIKETLSIQIPKLGNTYNWSYTLMITTILYHDLFYTNLQEADSQRGYMLFLINDTGKYMSLILDYHR